MYYMDVFCACKSGVRAHTDTHLHTIFALEKFRTLIDSREAGQMMVIVMATVVFGLVIVR